MAVGGEAHVALGAELPVLGETAASKTARCSGVRLHGETEEKKNQILGMSGEKTPEVRGMGQKKP